MLNVLATAARCTVSRPGPLAQYQSLSVQEVQVKTAAYEPKRGGREQQQPPDRHQTGGSFHMVARLPAIWVRDGISGSSPLTTTVLRGPRFQRKISSASAYEQSWGSFRSNRIRRLFSSVVQPSLNQHMAPNSQRPYHNQPALCVPPPRTGQAS